MYSWSYDPNYVTVTMGTGQEDSLKHKVKVPSTYDRIVFTPSQQEDLEAMELAYVLNEPRQDPRESVDLRHTTHSLKRQLRITWCKKALIGLVVALLMASAVTVVLIQVLGLGVPSSGNNSTVFTTKGYGDCRPDQFTCSPAECIPARWRCDERVDCLNGADEKLCGNYTASPSRSCQAWKAEFRINCPPSGCPFYPTCTGRGHWEPVQCTADNASCWCVDWATGAAVVGSFVKDVRRDGRPSCDDDDARLPIRLCP